LRVEDGFEVEDGLGKLDGMVVPEEMGCFSAPEGMGCFSAPGAVAEIVVSSSVLC